MVTHYICTILIFSFYSFLGTQMLYPIQELKVDVACLGNHDFDFSLPQVQHLMQQSQIPWLLSNVYNSENGRNLGDALAYYIKEVPLRPSGSIKVGFIGLAEEEWLNQITEVPQHLIQYEDYIHCAERLSRYLRNEESCSFIIGLTHMRIPNDQKLIKMLPQGTLDLVLGGHDHVWYKEKIGQTFYLKSGTNFRNLGLLRVHLFKREQQISIDWVDEVESLMKKTTKLQKLYKTIDDSKDSYGLLETSHSYHFKNSFSELNSEVSFIPINIIESVPKQPEMEAYVNDKVEKYNLETLKTIGFSDVDLETRFEKVRSSECNFTNFYSDMLKAEFQTDVCVLNSGTIRADELLQAGPITYQIINKIFAIPDVLVTYRISGQNLHKTLENGYVDIITMNNRVSKYPSYDGRFLAMSGIRIKFDPTQKEGKRILKENIEVNGGPIDYQKIYTIVTKLYVASGFDGFQEVPQEDFIVIDKFVFQSLQIDKSAGIPVSQVVQTFFETVRKSQMIRKISSQLEDEETQDGKLIKEKILEQLEKEDENQKTIFDIRYQKFKHIVKEVRTFDNEPYIVISPTLDGRIQIVNPPNQ